LFNYFHRRNRRRSAFVPVEGLESREVLSPVLVTSTPEPGGSVSLKFTGTSGDDVVFVSSDNNLRVGVGGGEFILNGGTSTSYLEFPRVHNISFSLGAGSDTVVVENVLLNNITIQDGVAVSDADQYRIFSSSGAMRVRDVDATFMTGAPELTIEALRISESATSILLNNITVRYVNTLSSHTRLLSNVGAQLNVAGEFRVDSQRSSSLDTVSVMQTSSPTAEAVPLRFHGATRLFLGGGNDSVVIIGTVDFRGQTFVDTGSGDDFLSFSASKVIGESANIVCFGRVFIEMGAGTDNLSFEADGGENRVRFMNSVSVSTGRDPDFVNVIRAVFHRSLNVHLGNNTGPGSNAAVEDSLSVNQVTVLGHTVVRSTGAAFVAFHFAGDSTSRFVGNATFKLGSGTITFGGGPDSQIIFESAQIFIGTRSKITVKYLSPVRANLTRRRLINAVVQ